MMPQDSLNFLEKKHPVLVIKYIVVTRFFKVYTIEEVFERYYWEVSRFNVFFGHL